MSKMGGLQQAHEETCTAFKKYVSLKDNEIDLKVEESEFFCWLKEHWWNRIELVENILKF